MSPPGQFATKEVCFLTVLEVWPGLSTLPREDSGGGYSLLPVSGVAGSPWAPQPCGSSSALRLLVAVLPLVSPNSFSPCYICRDTLSRQGHIYRFWVDLSFKGILTFSNPVSGTQHDVSRTGLLCSAVLTDNPILVVWAENACVLDTLLCIPWVASRAHLGPRGIPHILSFLSTVYQTTPLCSGQWKPKLFTWNLHSSDLAHTASCFVFCPHQPLCLVCDPVTSLSGQLLQFFYPYFRKTHLSLFFIKSFLLYSVYIKIYKRFNNKMNVLAFCYSTYKRRDLFGA